jgi:hypothetical protein
MTTPVVPIWPRGRASRNRPRLSRCHGKGIGTGFRSICKSSAMRSFVACIRNIGWKRRLRDERTSSWRRPKVSTHAPASSLKACMGREQPKPKPSSTEDTRL